jgi:hypothetical protein
MRDDPTNTLVHCTHVSRQPTNPRAADAFGQVDTPR